MEKLKIAIYPYSQEIDPVLNYIYFLTPQYEIVSLISPKGWGYANNAISLGKSESRKNIQVLSSLDDMDNSINCIFIPEFNASEKFESDMIDNISIVLPRITKIICAQYLKKDNLEKLQKLCVSTNGKCELEIKNNIKTEYDYKLEIQDEENYLENIPVPIIAVAGMWENVDKFYTSLALRDILLKNGYKVSQIGSRNYCEMLGFHSFPDFMITSQIDESKKVILFNRYIKQIYDVENPDVIIIGVPGAVQSLNAFHTNKFGILHYLVFKAIIVDFLIMCTFYETNGKEFFKLISESCAYKFGCPADCFHMSNHLFSSISLNESNIIEYLVLSRKKVSETLLDYYKDLSIPIINVFDESGITELYEKIIGKLTINQINIY